MKAAHSSTNVVRVAFLLCLQFVWLVHSQSEASAASATEFNTTSGESTASAVAVGTSDGTTGSTSCFAAASGDASAEATVTAGSSQSDCGEQASGPADSMDPTPAKASFCENNCLLPALGGYSTTLPSSCESLCPEYKTPEEFLDPDLTCTQCPDETCSLCRCDTGACLDNDSGCEQGDASADADGEVACAFVSSPVNGFCAYCTKKQQCKHFWWCK